MPSRYVVVDVFTDTPLRGNGLAVFADADGIDPGLMQPLARELNQSETAFVLTPGAGADARLRIFTPTAELPFAGHPVLGSACVVAAERGLDRVVFETGSGLVPVELVRDGETVTGGTMSQPIPVPRVYERESELLAALGVNGSGLPVLAYLNGPDHVYVELEDSAAVAALKPDLAALAELGPIGANCFAGGGRIWKTRMFAPGLGVAEDPATGSAAGPLAIHLASHGRIGFGEQIEIEQGAEIGRLSLLRATAHGEAGRIDRVEVGGGAVVVARGEFEF